MLRNASAEVARPLLSRNVELICFALCVAQCVYLIASLMQGSWILDPAGQPIPADFVNVWASGQQVLGGHPLDVYDGVGHKAAEVATVGHPFVGEFPSDLSADVSFHCRAWLHCFRSLRRTWPGWPFHSPPMQ